MPSWAKANRCVESLNGTLRDALLNGEIICKLREAKMLTELWGMH